MNPLPHDEENPFEPSRVQPLATRLDAMAEPRADATPLFRLDGWLTRCTVALLCLAFAVHAVQLWFKLQQVAGLWSLGPAVRIDSRTASYFQDELLLVPLLLAVGGPLSIVLLMWVYRVHANLRALGEKRLAYSSGWAVWAFLIPIANVVLAYRVLREIWRGSLTPRDQLSSHGRAPLLLCWWALGIAACVLAGAATGLSSAARTPLELCVVVTVAAAGLALSIAGTLTAVAFVLQVDYNQAARYLARSKRMALRDRVPDADASPTAHNAAALPGGIAASAMAWCSCWCFAIGAAGAAARFLASFFLCIESDILANAPAMRESLARSYRENMGVVGAVEGAAVLSAGVVFLMWLYAVRRNLLSMGVHGLAHTPAEAVLSWFVPVKNFYEPEIVMRETWRYSMGPDASPSRSHKFIDAWWITLVLAVCGTLWGHLAAWFGKPDHLVQTAWLNAVTGGLLAAAAVMFIRIVRTITQNLIEAYWSDAGQAPTVAQNQSAIERNAPH